MNGEKLPDDTLPIGPLREAYLSARPRTTAEEVAQRAMMAASEGVPRRTTGRRLRIGAVAAGLVTLAAAALLITVVGRERAKPTARPAPLTTIADTTSSAVAVQVPEGRNAIVLSTKDPLISVVWLY